MPSFIFTYYKYKFLSRKERDYNLLLLQFLHTRYKYNKYFQVKEALPTVVKVVSLVNIDRKVVQMVSKSAI